MKTKVVELSEDLDYTKSRPLGLVYVIFYLCSTELSLGARRTVVLHIYLTSHSLHPLSEGRKTGLTSFQPTPFIKVGVFCGFVLPVF